MSEQAAMTEERVRILGIAASMEVEECLQEIRRLRAAFSALEGDLSRRVEELEEHSARENFVHEALRTRIDQLLAANTAEVERRRIVAHDLREAVVAHDHHCALSRPCIFDVNRERDLRESADRELILRESLGSEKGT